MNSSETISAAVAKNLMDARANIIRNLKEDLKRVAIIEKALAVEAETNNDPYSQELHIRSQNHINSIASGKNCFIFSREDVARFFNNNDCTDFLVILAAKSEDSPPDNTLRGDQTVILVGCRKITKATAGDDSIVYESLPGTDGEEATQHPNFETMIEFPSSWGKSHIQFSFK